MAALTGIITLLIVVGTGLVVTRIATVALMFTGLSRDLARFQARSAFTLCGYTTAESERILDHPVRRRIIMLLMLLGNGVVVTAISSLIPVFLPTGEAYFGYKFVMHMLLLAAGMLVIWAISISKWIDDRLYVIISWALRNFTRLEVHDYHSLLHLSEGYSVTQIQVETGDWVVGKNLAHLRLSDEGLQILGIRRHDGEYIGTPTGGTYIRNGDTLLVYGRSEQLAELENRQSGMDGDAKHEQRIAAQRLTVEEQQRHDLRPPRAPAPPAAVPAPGATPEPTSDPTGVSENPAGPQP